ncbi:MAG: hypothetical protein EOO70_08305, partial [Myxococcaceae bacterium]
MCETHAMRPLLLSCRRPRATSAIAAVVGIVGTLVACGAGDRPSSSVPEVPGVGTWTALRAQSSGVVQAAWNGSELFLWGDARGGLYSLGRDEWTPATTEGEPGVRGEEHALGILQASLLWMDSERVLLWGGLGCGPIQSESCDDGFVYDAARDTWSKLDAESPPLGRHAHSTVWTGDRMIVWGGVNLDAENQLLPLSDGAIYDPATNRWSPISGVGAPSRRSEHTAVWTGTKMIVWGGWEQGESSPKLPEDGAVYDLASDTWTPMTRTGAPFACHDHTGSRFCAAFHRATLLLPGGAIQPNLSISKYYPGDAPHNKYARIVHEVQVDHMGYTFPYDDVKPDFNSEVSGTISG